MITINRTEAKQIIAASQTAKKPKLIISISKSDYKPTVVEKNEPVITDPNMEWVERVPTRSNQKKLSDECWAEYNELRIEQAKVANEIHDLVERDASKKEIADLYARVESFRPDLITLFERARHAEQYGALPPVQDKPIASAADILSLKDQKRKLVDKRCKLQAKIKKGGSLNSPKVLEWQMEFDLAEIEYNDIDERLKKLEGKA